MDAIAIVIGYGVLIFGAFWILNKVLSANDEAKDAERSIAYERNVLGLRKLYWGDISEQEKEAIKAFSMGYGFSGWHSIVTTDAEYLAQTQKLGHMRKYSFAKELLEREGNPYKLENCKVVPTKGTMHTLP
jgi:hypothetical protein